MCPGQYIQCIVIIVFIMLYVQGMLPLYPVTPDTGGTVVVPRSHTSHHHLLDTHRAWAKQPDRDFCVLNKTDPMQVTISRLLGKYFK